MSGYGEQKPSGNRCVFTPAASARRRIHSDTFEPQFPLSRPFVPVCNFTMREDCPRGPACPDVHFVRALRPHTEVSLGDCSYLNTCHRMSTCRYVHWILEDPAACTAPILVAPTPSPSVSDSPATKVGSERRLSAQNPRGTETDSSHTAGSSAAMGQRRPPRL